jgi:tryptophanyl-tRNA synthetase
MGNYLGALANWVDMQEKYDCFFFVADWHALTTDYENTESLETNVRHIMIDWLGAGLSPEKCTMFLQSRIPEHAELYMFLCMITPVPWLERNPTYKDQIIQLQNKDLSTFGFLGYPVLQAADIIMYKAHGVPVGVDQVPHVEITREIARRFNHLYEPVFPEPESILTRTPKILGLDRRKMSKSYDNAIYLSDTAELMNAKVMQMVTDPRRARRKDPGNPDICNVYEFHKLFTDQEKVAQINEQCHAAEIGCVECKKVMAENLVNAMAPIVEKRRYYVQRPDEVADIIEEGSRKARDIARQTMEEVRSAIHVTY